MLGGDEDDDSQNYDGTQSDLIPGSNDLPLPSTPPWPTDAPPNLTRIPEQGGDLPIVSEPIKPSR